MCSNPYRSRAMVLDGCSSSSSSSSNFICHYNKHTDATHRQQNYLHSIIMARRYRKTFRLSSQDISWLGCIVIVFVSEGD